MPVIPESADPARFRIPTEAEYVESYCRRMGLDLIPAFDFCLAFNFFRMAAILQGVKKRGPDGNASNPERAAKVGRFVPVYARMGLEAAGK